jgi:hypothetical protein
LKTPVAEPAKPTYPSALAQRSLYIEADLNVKEAAPQASLVTFRRKNEDVSICVLSAS